MLCFSDPINTQQLVHSFTVISPARIFFLRVWGSWPLGARCCCCCCPSPVLTWARVGFCFFAACGGLGPLALGAAAPARRRSWLGPALASASSPRVGVLAPRRSLLLLLLPVAGLGLGPRWLLLLRRVWGSWPLGARCCCCCCCPSPVLDWARVCSCFFAACGVTSRSEEVFAIGRHRRLGRLRARKTSRSEDFATGRHEAARKTSRSEDLAIRNDPERRRVTTDRAPSRARRCRHPSFALTFSFLATARG
jgi:hypothetical protein